MRTPISWYGARLRAMSPREVAWRAGARLRASARGTKARETPDWGGARWHAALRGLVETHAQSFVADANRIASGELDLWGRRVVVDPRAPHWHRDPLRGVAAGSARGRRSHDLKPIWELHRQQHLVPLAAGAAVAGREDWARLCAAQMLDWIEGNPPRRGPGWSSGYETAHRLVGWAWAVPLIADSLSGSELDRISRSYAMQADFATIRPSHYSSANNHRLAELTGLLAAAVVGVGTERWDGLWAELEAEAARQTYPDGGSREQAAGYFLYVVEILWTAGILGWATGRGLGRIGDRLRAMLGWLEAVADTREEPPPVGDDAEDRMLRIDYFEPRRAAAIAGRVEALLREESTLLPATPPLPRSDSVLLPDSGYAVLRSRAGSALARLVFDIGELGFGSLAAHGHADALAVLLDLDGRPVLRDSGTYSYAPADGRDEFRESAAHNTVVVDRASQAEALGPHLWGRRFRPRLEAASLGDSVDYVRASHDGYRSHASGAIHTRSVAYLKPDLIVVLDRVRARRECTAQLVWQLPPGAAPEGLGAGDAAITVLALPDPQLALADAPFSPRYRSRRLAARCTWSATGSEIVYATVVALGTGERPAAELSHAGGETAVQILTPGRARLVERWSDSSISVHRSSAVVA
jgi:Heparinase II/III-like protein/Heparinase II/III N-terminus